MRNIILIAWREFAENAKTKGFWLGIFLFPFIWVLASQIPILLNKKATPTRYFVLVDQTSEFEPVVTAALAHVEARRLKGAFRDYAIGHLKPGIPLPSEADWSSADGAGFDLARATAGMSAMLEPNAPAFRPPRSAFMRVSLPPPLTGREPVEEIERQTRNYVSGRLRYRPSEIGAGDPIALFAVVLIPRGFGDSGGLRSGRGPRLRYWCENQADNELRNQIEQALTAELRHREYRREGFDPAAIARIESIQAPITQLDPNKAAGEEKVGVADTLRQWAPSAFVYLLWVAIFSISQMLLNSLIEEKSSRVVEVLLSSVTPGELMMGKLAGIATVGLVMLTAWIGTLAGIVAYMALSASRAATVGSAGPASVAAEIPHDIAGLLTDTWLLPAFAIYFILGYLLYAGIFLALGSTCNTIKDAQNYMAVIVLVLMVPLLSMTFIPRDPNGQVATFLSWIPPYTPFVMMNRIIAHPPWRDVAGTFVLLVVFDALVLWGCGKIFRIGVLRTGQPPGLVQLLGWLRIR